MMRGEHRQAAGAAAPIAIIHLGPKHLRARRRSDTSGMGCKAEVVSHLGNDAY
jgi:hypothetical protein